MKTKYDCDYEDYNLSLELASYRIVAIFFLICSLAVLLTIAVCGFINIDKGKISQEFHLLCSILSVLDIVSIVYLIVKWRKSIKLFFYD